MTVREAIDELQEAGKLTVSGATIRCRLPRRRSPEQERALEVLRHEKSQALDLLGGRQDAQSLEAVLKGHAIALYCDLVKQTLWLVADDQDAAKLGERRGLIYTADEIRLLAAIDDPEIVKEVHKFKDVFNVPMRKPDA